MILYPRIGGTGPHPHPLSVKFCEFIDLENSISEYIQYSVFMCLFFQIYEMIFNPGTLRMPLCATESKRLTAATRGFRGGPISSRFP